MPNVSFKISSALKTIIGKELITDDFIAVFELVKNSFDAYARKVEIIFDGLKSDNPRIIIIDNGVGMNEEDIMDKWLFVAYSAKKTGEDYRDKIKSDRVFAGAKGIGRFSCDRLGAKLKLITRKNTKGAWHILEVDWNRFEKDPHSQFQNIKADLSQTRTTVYPDISSGTILEISELRNQDWSREKLLELRRSLERLINPYQTNEAKAFSIFLTVPEEKEQDKVTKKEMPDQPWAIVNGPVKNFIFETLDLKTTQIQLEIDNDGKLLFTKLLDRGTLVYELVENNPYKELLHDIKINLFHLNRAAKVAFSRRMGLRPRDFGSVFLYKNGFRIHPFGNFDDDTLEIDRRKQQGVFRFLGSRDLSGRIEITQVNERDVDLAFTETSSRDGGLIKNKAYSALKEMFFEYALRRLENYVINLAKFGEGGDFPELIDPNSAEQRKLTFDLIVKLTQSKDVVDINYSPKVLNILENRSSESVSALLRNLERIAAEQNNPKLHKEISRAERQVTILKKAKEEAEAETTKERERAEKAEQQAREAEAQAQEAAEAVRKAKEENEKTKSKAKDVDTENLFLKSILSKDLQHVIDLHHSIGQDADAIEVSTTTLLSLLRDDTKNLKPEMLRASLERINITARRIYTISRFATHANFRADAEIINADVVEYIREYLLNVHGGFILDPQNQKIEFQVLPNELGGFVTRFTPIKVSIVLDNLIYNSRKHKSKHIVVNVIEKTSERVVVSFKDDGRGIQKKNFPQLFQVGFTTTNGSGLGLHHSKRLMSEMNGDIVANESFDDGAEFLLTFRKSEG